MILNYISSKYLKYFLIIIILIVVLLINSHFSKKTLPYLGEINDFTLYNQNGIEFNKKDLIGNFWISDFIFTTCAGPCPVMSSQFQSFQEKYSKFDNLNLLSISVNPQYDTPNVLSDYGKRFNADFDKWNFLTGDVNEIHNLALESFNVGSAEDPIFHSAFFILLDDEAKIRGYYNSTLDKDLDKMHLDIDILISENI